MKLRNNRLVSSDRVRTVFEGLWKFRKNGISFSRPWKSVKTEWGLWKFVNFVVFRALGKKFQLISQKLHFPRPNSSFKKIFKKNCRAKSQRMYFQSVLTDKVYQPLATVRVVPIYQTCGRVAYLCVAFLPHLAKVCEFWMDFSVQTLSESETLTSIQKLYNVNKFDFSLW